MLNCATHRAGQLSLWSRRFPMDWLPLSVFDDLNLESKVVPVIPRAFEERLHIPEAEGSTFRFLFPY